MVSLCISAIASNQGKTILTSALLYHFKKSVRPFKIGPDFIDPQFHRKICGTESINLDGFMMNTKQLKWLYNCYSDKGVSICEGVMGYYDGMDKRSSAYDVTRTLNIPTILLLDGSGSYITVSAVLKGLKSYKKGNTIRGVVLNRISSQSHYELIKTQIEKDFADIAVAGWISNHLTTLSDTHLGLDLEDMDKLETISQEVLAHIDIEKIKTIGVCAAQANTEYPFKPLAKCDKTVAVVRDENFSFVYHDNLCFLREVFERVLIVRPSHDETIPEDCDSVYICGGYVETEKAYAGIKNAHRFKDSLIQHARTKKIYAECAGLLYLGQRVDEKTMSGILDVSFTLQKRFERLGYYTNEAGVKGHAFHYTRPIDDSTGFDILSKSKRGSGKVGSWQNTDGKVFGTYLHTLFRSNPSLVKKEADVNRFEPRDREILKAILSARRDVRGHHFLDKPIEPTVLDALLEAAISAPSVGFSQPWKFVIVQDSAKREEIYDEFVKENTKAAKMFHDDPRYASLKLEGIKESPFNIAVLYQKPTKTVLGQTTQKKMGEYSVVCAIQNLWLTARAYNVGVGWVSILRAKKVKKILGISREYKLVGYLTLGYVSEFLDEPELLKLGWDKKKRVEEVVQWV